MDYDAIHIYVEYIHPGKFEGADTIRMATMYIETKYPNALRVEFRGTERRKQTMIIKFHIWVDDAHNILGNQ